MISQSRWEQIICEVAKSLDYYKFGVELTKEELDVVVSVLKNNTPFRVVPDCCLGDNQKVSNNNQQVVSIDHTVSDNNHWANTADVVWRIERDEDVVLETKNFSVLGDKE